VTICTCDRVQAHSLSACCSTSPAPYALMSLCVYRRICENTSASCPGLYRGFCAKKAKWKGRHDDTRNQLPTKIPTYPQDLGYEMGLFFSLGPFAGALIRGPNRGFQC
jgi:hypothetical protein